LKRKRQCPGYRDFFEAIHKDETLILPQKNVPKRQKKSPSPPEPCDESSPEESSMILMPITSSDAPAPQWLDDGNAEVALYAQPSRDIAMESLSYFFANYVNIPRDPSTNIFIEHILPMYINSSANSALTEAIHAVAFNVTSMWMFKFVDSHLARESYGRALGRLKVTLEDPIQSKTDETLATVFMLDFYDSLNQRMLHFVDTGTHQQGAVALLRHRGQDNFKTPLSQRLFNAMRSRHINYSLLKGRDVQLDPELLTDDTAVLPSAKLDLLNVKLAKLYAFARTHCGGPDLIEFYNTVMNRASLLERKFQAWSDSLPLSWQPMAVDASQLQPSIRKAGVYKDMCDVYSSLAVSHVSSSARSSHIGALRLVILCLEKLKSLGIPTDPDLETHVYSTTQALVDRFCASIPFHLGDRTNLSSPHERSEYPEIPVELRRLANYVDPFGNQVELTMDDHARAAAAIGGWFIMTPLVGFLKAPALMSPKSQPGPLLRRLRPGQLEWIRGQMFRVQKLYQIGTTNLQRILQAYEAERRSDVSQPLEFAPPNQLWIHTVT
jgi:hypothetical protein